MYTKKIKNIIYAAIGIALSFTSVQVSARQADDIMPSQLCFHIFPDPNHPDPLGSYLVLRSTQIGKVRIQKPNLKLREVNGISIGRLPILTTPTPEWGDWVGNPITGTCHPHDGTFQCTLHSISSITTPFPPGPILSSIETAQGDATIVYNRNKGSRSIVLAQRGSVDVTYFDPAGETIPSDSELLSGLGLKTFKKIENFIKSPDIYEVRCRDVPHPEIPPFTVPMPE